MSRPFVIPWSKESPTIHGPRLGRANLNEEVCGRIHLHRCWSISWQARSQSAVALSTLEAEYIAASDATREAIWLRQTRNDMCTPDPYGSAKATRILKAKTRHIDIKYRHIHCDQKNHKTVNLYSVSTELNIRQESLAR